MKIGLFLPGQGFQQAGMLAKFAKAYPRIVNPVLEQVDAALPKLGLSKALLDPEYPENITPTYLAQPLILSATYAIFKAYESQNTTSTIKYVMGHSLGEYSAWTVSEILPFEQAVKLVHERGLAMHKATENTDTGMVLIVKPRKNAADFENQLADALHQNGTDFGNINSLTETVISGQKIDLKNTLETLQRWHPRLITKWLNVSGAFHSKWMAPAQPRLAELAEQVDWSFPGKYEVVSNLTASPFQSLDEVKASCAEMLVKPVQWQKSAAFVASEVDAIVSLGPGKIGKSTQNEYQLETIFYNEP